MKLPLVSEINWDACSSNIEGRNKGAAVQAQWTSGKAYHFTLYTTSGGLMEKLQCYEWLTSSFIVHINL
jgi:hypothetical protein